MGWGIHPSCLNFVTLVFQPFSGPMVVSWISNYCTTHSQANEPSLSEKQNGECVHRSANVCTVLGGRSRGRLGGKGGGWASEKWGDLCILGWVHTTHCAPHFPPTHSAECIETSWPKYFLPSRQFTASFRPPPLIRHQWRLVRVMISVGQIQLILWANIGLHLPPIGQINELVLVKRGQLLTWQ